MKNILLLIMLSLVHVAQAQLSPQLEYIKIWNFLKYYHPDLASGKVDADSIFLAHIESPSLAINSTVAGLTAALKPVPETNPQATDKQEVLTKNQNFDWYLHHPALLKKYKQKLSSIYRNRHQDTAHFYVPSLSYTQDIPNEQNYNIKKDENPPLGLRLLTLAKIKGAIDYLYPHKYLMAVDAEAQFDQLVHATMACTNRLDFDRILAKAVSSMEDSHAFRFQEQLSSRRDIFNSGYYAPFGFHVTPDALLITAIIDSARCAEAQIQVGDRIQKINGMDISQVLNEKKSLLSVSNINGLRHHLADYQQNLIWPDSKPQKQLHIQLGGGSDLRIAQVSFLNPRDTLDAKKIIAYIRQTKQQGQPASIFNDRYAYFKIDETFAMIDDVQDDQVDKHMHAILDTAAKKEAIVFDMRGYPDWGGFVYHYIYGFFGPEQNYFARYYQQNLANIGTFHYQEAAESYFPALTERQTKNYPGKVFILVNAETLSASEWNTMNLQHIFPLAVTIGEQTAGADGDIKKLMLPLGYSLVFTGNAVYYPNGQQTQKTGIRIDHHVQRSDRDIIQGRDVALEIVTQELMR